MARDALFPDGLVRPKSPYSPVVRSGDHVYTAGQVGFDATGTLVKGGVAEQTRQTLANLEACLAAAAPSRWIARRAQAGSAPPPPTTPSHRRSTHGPHVPGRGWFTYSSFRSLRDAVLR